MEEKTHGTIRFQERYILFGIDSEEARSLYLGNVGETRNVEVRINDLEGELTISFYTSNQRYMTKVRKVFLKSFSRFILLPANKQLETGFYESLVKNKYRVSVAESVTGGMIAARILDQAGASDILGEAYVVYSDAAKQKILHVDGDLLKKHGAVSETVARKMAVSLQEKSGADITIATTGFAGPGGGTDDDPVGTVYFGFGVCEKTYVVRKQFPGNRNHVRKQASAYALAWIINHLERGN